jgi:hypothetical protein
MTAKMAIERNKMIGQNGSIPSAARNDCQLHDSFRRSARSVNYMTLAMIVMYMTLGWVAIPGLAGGFPFPVFYRT